MLLHSTPPSYNSHNTTSLAFRPNWIFFCVSENQWWKGGGQMSEESWICECREWGRTEELWQEGLRARLGRQPPALPAHSPCAPKRLLCIWFPESVYAKFHWPSVNKETVDEMNTTQQCMLTCICILFAHAKETAGFITQMTQKV